MAIVHEGRSKLRIPKSRIRPKISCCDNETGELMTYQINNETGEPTIESHMPPSGATGKTINRSIEFSPETGKMNKYQALKASIIEGSNVTSHRMLLLIPTLMIFPSFICVMLVMLEIYLHVRCHKKNKELNDPSFYYRSPFHVVTSTFCGECRESDMASKVGQLQDKRRHHYDYFRRITI